MAGIPHRFVSQVTRRYPLLSGGARIANSDAFLRICGRDTALVWCQVPGGQVLGSLNDFVGRAAYYFGDLDPKLSAVLKAWVRPGDTVLDIGANIGVLTVHLAHLVGDSGRVHAFEPNPVVASRLQQAIEHNRLGNVALHRIALGSEEATLHLRAPRNNLGEGHLCASSDVGDFEDSYPVRVRRLDDELQLEGAPIRLMKLDVEGHETEVLKGASGLLTRDPPDAVLFEINTIRRGSMAKHETLDLLADHGYRFFQIPRALLKLRLRPFDPLTDPLHSHDVLAVHKSVRDLPSVCGNSPTCREARPE
jgi:FkbM family methyltransferase